MPLRQYLHLLPLGETCNTMSSENLLWSLSSQVLSYYSDGTVPSPLPFLLESNHPHHLLCIRCLLSDCWVHLFGIVPCKSPLSIPNLPCMASLHILCVFYTNASGSNMPPVNFLSLVLILYPLQPLGSFPSYISSCSLLKYVCFM